MRVLLAILTVMLGLAMFVGTIVSFATHRLGLGVVCLVFAVGIAFFVRNDFLYFWDNNG